MVEPIVRGGDVALFIDWENFKISLAAGNRSPNLSSLKEEISEHGRVVVAKAYADWVTRAPELRGASQFINDPPSLYAAGIEPVFVPTRVPSTQASSANGMRTYRVKNSVDVKMTADCIECAHSYPNIGTFVLVSGDSDFLHVVNALRTMGKRVVIIGVSWSTSRRLADQVDSLLLYDKDVDPLAPQPAVLPQHAPQREAHNEAPELTDVIRAIEEIIRDDRAAGGQPLLTSIKQRLMRRYPGFDEKKLGYSGFKKLMGRVAEDGNIKLIHAGLVDWAIMADEETPESATEEAPSEAATTARSGRRRGGRRRHGGQRDADATDGESAEDAADAQAAEDADAAGAYIGAGAMYAESPEETAATDFEAPVITQPVDTVEEAVAEEPQEAEVEVVDVAPEEVEETTDSVRPHPDPLPEDEGTPEEAAAPEDLFANDAELADAVREAIAAITLPAEPEDGQISERVSDLVVMAHTLEQQEGAEQVVYNSLVAAICGALEQGLEAGNAEISQRWSINGPRDYVSRMLRGLSDGDFFRRSTHHWREEGTGRRRQRSTFNLNRDNELVGRMLTARIGPAAPGVSAAEGNGAPHAEPVAEAPPVGDTDEPQPQAKRERPARNSRTGRRRAQPQEEPEQPPLSAAAAPEPPVPPAEDDPDEIFDEPQPRNVRRRPFTSRLLRS